MGAHFPGRDALVFVAEDVACEDVDDAEDEGEDAAADDDAPEGCAEGFLRCRFLVEVSEDGDAEDYH